jgi:hypothetical protein
MASRVAGLMSETVENTTAITIGTKTPTFQIPANWQAFQLLPCHLSVEIPVPGFTVSSLLRLAPNDVVNTLAPGI